MYDTQIDPARSVSFAMKGGEMMGYHLGDPDRAPDVIFLHATGLNARTYVRVLAPLAERFAVLLLDLRGHGRTRLPLKMWGYDSWSRHRDDVIALMDAHVRAPALFAGHSMGATTSLLIAGKRPDLVAGLTLVDPVILPDARYRLNELPFASLMFMRNIPIARAARRRRARFASREEAKAALTGRGFFKTWPNELLEDYVADGFIDDPKGGVTLSCTPAYEAATFAAQRNDPWGALSAYGGPIVALRAEIGSTFPPGAAQRFKQMRADIRLATVEGATHALPMERGDRLRAAIETTAMMAGLGVRGGED